MLFAPIDILPFFSLAGPALSFDDLLPSPTTLLLLTNGTLTERKTPNESVTV